MSVPAQSIFGRLSGHVENGLVKSWPVAAAACGLAGLGVVMGSGAEFSLAMPALAALAAVGISSTLPRKDRGASFGFFAWALLSRLLVIVVLKSSLSDYVDGGLLGPDAQVYFLRSRFLAESGFRLDSPFAFFGSVDIGAYYLFGVVQAIFGPHLLALEVMNASLSALVAPVAFAWGRQTVPRHAGLIAGLAAFSPSFVVGSTADLLKDPSVILATTLVVWAASRLLRGVPVERTIGWMGLLVFGLTFLHITRFYAAAYLEAGLLVVVGVGMVRNRADHMWRKRLGTVGAAIVLAEAICVAGGWQVSPAEVVTQVRYVAATPAMQEAGPAMQEATPDITTSSAPFLEKAIDVGRRVFGPFVWIAPTRFELKYLLLADFDLYPDTLLWYFTLPAVAIGILMTIASLRQNPKTSPELGPVALFLALYLAQYLAINVSYRQREDVLLLMLAFVPTGARWVLATRPGQVLYAGYWFLLIVVAAGHLIFRAHG